MKKLCDICGEAFETGNPKQKLCTNVCREKNRLKKLNSKWIAGETIVQTPTNAHPWKQGFSYKP